MRFTRAFSSVGTGVALVAARRVERAKRIVAKRAIADKKIDKVKRVINKAEGMRRCREAKGRKGGGEVGGE